MKNTVLTKKIGHLSDEDLAKELENASELYDTCDDGEEREEHAILVEAAKRLNAKEKYVVYFNANSDGCSGWLDTGTTDWVCFGHFMGCATEFDTPEEAKAAAEERMMKIEKIVADVVANPPPAYGQSEQPYKSFEERMKPYKYFIMKKPMEGCAE